MKKIIRPRQAGKSSELIRIAEETNAYIIVATRARAVCLADMAQKQGRHILYPVTLREYEQSRFRGSFIKHILIDDADDVLQELFREVQIAGELFDKLPSWCEPDGHEQWPLMQDRRNRLASRCGEYEWGWINNKVKSSSTDFCYVNYYGDVGYWGASSVLGVRPVFLIARESILD